jgi:hypothetical protein
VGDRCNTVPLKCAFLHTLPKSERPVKCIMILLRRTWQEVFRNTCHVELACSPISDPGVMRVSTAPRWGEETQDEEKAAYAGASHSEAA